MSAGSEPELFADSRYVEGVIVRLFRGSQRAIIRSSRGREIEMVYAIVDMRGPLRHFEDLREGMRVGFDVAWTSRGLRVSRLYALAEIDANDGDEGPGGGRGAAAPEPGAEQPVAVAGAGGEASTAEPQPSERQAGAEEEVATEKLADGSGEDGDVE